MPTGEPHFEIEVVFKQRVCVPDREIVISGVRSGTHGKKSQKGGDKTHTADRRGHKIKWIFRFEWGRGGGPTGPHNESACSSRKDSKKGRRNQGSPLGTEMAAKCRREKTGNQ